MYVCKVCGDGTGIRVRYYGSMAVNFDKDDNPIIPKSSDYLENIENITFYCANCNNKGYNLQDIVILEDEYGVD